MDSGESRYIENLGNWRVSSNTWNWVLGHNKEEHNNNNNNQPTEMLCGHAYLPQKTRLPQEMNCWEICYVSALYQFMLDITSKGPPVTNTLKK